MIGRQMLFFTDFSPAMSFVPIMFLSRVHVR